MPASTSASTSHSFWLPSGLLLLGCAGFAALWIMLALAIGRQCSWMAILAALDAALLLRLGRVKPGWRRAAIAVAATIVIIALANWGIAAAYTGAGLGFDPWQSALRLGLHHGWTLIRLANGASDLVWLGSGLLVAWWAAR